jgi:mRNA interferase MazF
VIFEADDIVVVPFPFTDQAATKRRPALVLSGSAFNAAAGHVVLAMITGDRTPPWPLDVPLTDWTAAGLTKPCKVRAKLFALDARLILRKTGRLTADDAAAVRLALADLMQRTP